MFPGRVVTRNISLAAFFLQVESRDSIFGFENGLVQNMFGDMKRGDAKSRYHVHNKRHPEVNGGILVASWSDKAMDAPSLFYGAEDNASAIIGSLECSKGSVTLHDADVYVGDGDTSWGTVLECAEGPSVTNTNETSLPTIILSRGSKRYIIVEESSSYPNFMYSVWTTDSRTDADVKIQHEFHISSSMRLAEAVVTGIVQAAQNEEEPTGGGCFSLLRQYSENNVGYSDELERASPFGEHPSGDFSGIKSLSEVESVVDGIGLNVNALMCVVWLIVVTLIGVAWSYFLSFSIGMDIYNRDELIRAVSIQDPPSSGGPSSDIRIFVHRKDTGHIGVVIRDSGEERGGCLQFFNRRAKQVKPVLAAATTAMPETDCPPSTPAPSVRAFALGAIRLGMERSMPGRDGNYCYPTTSPVDSEIFLEETPVPNLSILTPTVPNSDFLGKRGASALFDNSMHSTSFATSFQSEGDTETGLVKHEGVT